LRLEKIVTQTGVKIFGIGFRLLSYFKSIPTRASRLLKHVWSGILFFRPGQLRNWKFSIYIEIIFDIGKWWLELFIYAMDCFGIPECYETIQDFIKFNTRALNKREIAIAKSVFGNSIDYRRVRIDDYSLAGPKQKKFCYVSFYIINSWGPMHNSIYIHEMTHIWQFEKMGSVYIPHALIAQRSKMGYNYGGVSGLKNCQEKGKRFLSFNLEQQGEIVSDYYRLKNGYKPHWGDGRQQDLPIYESFIDQLGNG
jgi:hypothetical protein